MANPTLEALSAQITKTTDVEKSAALLITGFSARMQAAVDAALLNGATAAELAPVTDEIALLNSSATSLAAAVEANTPAA